MHQKHVHKYFGARMVPAAIELEAGEQHYEVEKLLTHRDTTRSREYLVRWSGYDESELELAEFAPDVLTAYKTKAGL